MHCVNRGVAIAAAASSLVSFSSSAAIEPSVEAVLVTAARVEQTASEVIGSASLITREQIERRQVRSVQDLLLGETGLSVVNNGGLGKLSNVYMRGANAGQILVLVDGVRVGSATSGTTPFEFVPIDQIERIEIVRGPRSSLYGADAIGGVIQIFTRRANGPAFSLGAGSHDTYDTSASFGTTSGPAWLSVSASRLQSDGYNSCDGLPTGGGCFTYEPDNDGFDNTSGTLRAGFRWGEIADIEASALYTSGTTEFDGSFTNETDFAERVLTLRGHLKPTRAWDVRLVVGSSSDDQDNLLDDPLAGSGSLRVSQFDTERRSASLQSDLSLADAQLLSLGLDYVDDLVDSTTAFTEGSRSNLGLFGQYQAQIGAHRALLSARYDDNEQFGSHVTANLGWKWALTQNLALTAAWGSAFGAPTFNDLYFPGFSNPDLQPEEADSYEVGLSGTAGVLRWSLAAFENRIDQLIVFDAAISAPNNLNEARIRGIEVEATAAIGGWSLALGYAGLDPRNRSPGENFDNVLPRRARHSGHFEVGRAFGALDATVRLAAEGSRYDNVANTVRLGSYAIVDLALSYALSPQWSVQGRIANALDRDYQTVRLFDQDGRTFFMSVRYQPR